MSLKRDEVVILSKYRMLSTGAKLKLQGYLDGLGE